MGMHRIYYREYTFLNEVGFTVTYEWEYILFTNGVNISIWMGFISSLRMRIVLHTDGVNMLLWMGYIINLDWDCQTVVRNNNPYHEIY